MQAVLGGGGDPGLVLAAERERVAGVGGRAAVGRGRPTGRERTRGEAGGGDTAADQASPGESASLLLLGRVVGQDSTAAVSCDNGSESALTAFDRSFTWSCVRSS
ncbi:hypothetical protein GCM10009795_010790 [Nocardioides hankookensis]